MREFNHLKIITLILAGGKGERLYPLTKFRTKPAVPFGGKYRIIDFVLSNLTNSGFLSIYVLTQYKAQSLTEHIEQGWQLGSALRRRNFFITIAPAQMWMGEEWYKGTADAVYQNFHLLSNFDPDIVLVFAADHIYKMDVSQMLKFHLEKDADFTVCGIPVTTQDISHYGIICSDNENRVCGFWEKPKTLPSEVKDKKLFISMGNYIFKREFLEEILIEDSKDEKSSHDFGKDILPKVYKNLRVFIYDFSKNKIRGEETHYWRDVGTIKEYYEANMDLLKIPPPLNLWNPHWTIGTVSFKDPPCFIEKNAEVYNSIIAEGTRIFKGARVINSIIGRNCIIEENAIIEDSIIHYGVKIRKKSIVKNCIIDKFVEIEKETNVWEDKKENYEIRDNILIIPSPPPSMRIGKIP
ncbi:MAG: glucose-1-phosphate adenylyltransferase [candidate division WOR-3 bacterium]